MSSFPFTDGVNRLSRLLRCGLLAAVAALSAPNAKAAALVAAEYFIGNDPGQGLGRALALTESGSLATGFEQASLSLAGLAPGTYSIGLRVRDDQGRWSNPAIRRFTLGDGDFQLAGGLDREGDATQGMDGNGGGGVGSFAGGAHAEYFVGNDPGEGLGTAMVLADLDSLATGFEQASLSLVGLLPGTYSIGLRVKDDQGRWSNPAIRRFTLGDGDFQLAGGLDREGDATQGMEGNGAGGVGSFAGGAHAEYFVGNDPGEGRGTALVLADRDSLATGFQQASLSLAGLAPGTYSIGLRVKDDEGRWSNPAIRRFTLGDGDFQLAGGLDRDGDATQGMDGNGAGGVGSFAGGAHAEYFVGNDPGEGRGTALVLADRDSLATGFEQASLSLAGLAPGTYSIGLRVKDDEGRWSNPAIRRFTLGDGDFELAGGLDREGDATQGMDGNGAGGVGSFAGGAHAEYFVGNDPGEGRGTALVLADRDSLATGFEQASLSLEDLAPGTYSIGLRVKDDEGRWSNPAIRRLTIQDMTLIAQTEAGLSGGTNSPSGEPQAQVWSLSPRKYFSVGVHQISIAGKILEIERRSEEPLRSFMLRLQQAISGDAFLMQRVVAELAGPNELVITNRRNGVSPADWVSVSSGLTVKVLRPGDLGSAGREIVAAEYFTDIDPGEGRGTPIPLAERSTGHQREFDSLSVNISELRSGHHRVGVRFKNAAGRWGAPVFRGYGSFSLFGDPDLSAPVITLAGADPLHLPFGEPFLEPGYSAADDRDGNLSANVVVTGAINPFIPGLQRVLYSVVDGSGNLTTRARQVVVVDETNPEFSGESQLVFHSPPATTDLYRGLRATDAELGSLSHGIRLVSGKVDWAVAGTYPLLFEVSDTAGNTSRFTRSVTLAEAATLYPNFPSWIAGRATGLGFSSMDLAADADPDQDGFTNVMEWSSDTDPFDEFSRLEMDSTRGLAGLTFEWEGNQRINYRIDTSRDLQIWEPYSQEVNTDKGAYFTLDVPIPIAPSSAFFRLFSQPRLPIMPEEP